MRPAICVSNIAFRGCEMFKIPITELPVYTIDEFMAIRSTLENYDVYELLLLAQRACIGSAIADMIEQVKEQQSVEGVR